MEFFDFNNKKPSGYKRAKLKPGEYTSTVKSVDWADGYVKGKAIKIAYDLVAKDGSEHEFSEIFWVNGSDRSGDFNQYLKDHGINHVDDFVGCKEKLTLLNDIHKGKTYLNIVEREFVSLGEDGDSDALEV